MICVTAATANTPVPRLIPAMELEAERWAQGDTCNPVADVFLRFVDELNQVADAIEKRTKDERAARTPSFNAFNPRNLECSVSL